MELFVGVLVGAALVVGLVFVIYLVLLGEGMGR